VTAWLFIGFALFCVACGVWLSATMSIYAAIGFALLFVVGWLL
jgi:hypothetical protein